MPLENEQIHVQKSRYYCGGMKGVVPVTSLEVHCQYTVAEKKLVCIAHMWNPFLYPPSISYQRGEDPSMDLAHTVYQHTREGCGSGSRDVDIGL